MRIILLFTAKLLLGSSGQSRVPGARMQSHLRPNSFSMSLCASFTKLNPFNALSGLLSFSMLNIGMRYREIVESTPFEKAQKTAQKRIKANRKLADAQRKKSDAGQKYQDQLRKANDAQRDAQAALRST